MRCRACAAFVSLLTDISSECSEGQRLGHDVLMQQRRGQWGLELRSDAGKTVGTGNLSVLHLHLEPMAKCDMGRQVSTVEHANISKTGLGRGSYSLDVVPQGSREVSVLVACEWTSLGIKHLSI